jgi:glycosyltransferase involved in cell wall biosynthesis
MTESLRPHVVWIGTDLPWPLDSGFRIRAFENLRALAEFCRVTVVCLAEPPGTEERACELAEQLPDTARVLAPVDHDIHIRRDPAKLAKAFASGMSRGLPYKVAKFRSAAMETRLREALEGQHVDVVHVELATSPYAEFVASIAEGPCRVVLDEHNIESELLLEHCSNRSFGVLTPIAFVEALRTRAFERDTANGVDLVFLISDEDRDMIERMTSGGVARTCVVPPVVELEHGTAARPTGSVRGGARPTLTFVGQMSWLPNEEAMRFFADEVMPCLLAGGTDPRVVVVGGGASPALKEHLEAAGIEVLGYVRDLAEVYRVTDVFIAPFTTGGGVRIKLIDAMAAGLPVVTTPAGAKGLEAAAGTALLVADGPEEFAGAVRRVIDNPGIAHRLVDGGLDYVRRHHSRASAVELMRTAYGSVLDMNEPPVEVEAAS